MSDTNRPPPMGWPWDQLADAAIRYGEADRRMTAAALASDRAARCAAELDRDTASADFRAVREEMARQWLSGLRAVLATQPANLAELLRDVPPSEVVVEAVKELEDRTDAAERDAKRARSEAWELALWLKRIEEQQTGAGDGNRGPRQGPTERQAVERQAG